MKPFTSQDFDLWADYIKILCGNILDSSKMFFVERHLAPIARELQCDNWLELYNKVRTDISGKLQAKVIEAITTNETSFFRDKSFFDLLNKKIFPELVAKRRQKFGKQVIKPLRIWSAACSSGQEAYSVAIAINEFLGSCADFDIRIMGTDISNKVVSKACMADYSAFEIGRGVTADILEKYFTMDGETWRVCDHLKAMTTFKSINLLEPFLFSHKFDIVLCRNVAIYFSIDDRKKLFHNIASVLAPDGYLLVGSTESITAICPQFKVVWHNGTYYYQLADAWSKQV